MYQVIRFFFRYGHEWDPIDCTFSHEFDSFDKALKHGERYAHGLRFESFQITDATGKVIYEMNDEGLITDRREGAIA